MALEAIVQLLNPAASGSNSAGFASLRRALEGLGAALRRGTQANDTQALRDVQAAASAEVWDGLWASGQSLPFWSRAGYARFRDEIQSLLRDLRNPVEEVSAAKCGRHLGRITPLLSGLDQWEERARRSETWWRGIKSIAFVGAGVFGTVAYFLLRAVGDLEVDAVTMLCPAPAPSDLARTSEERTRFLRDYSAYFFGQPNTAVPLFQQGLTRAAAVPSPHGERMIPEMTETERRLQSALTPSQSVYDWLSQGDPEGRFVFSARLVNRSSRGARFVKSLTTRLTLLETLEVPWNDLPVTPTLDCRLDVNSRAIVIHNQPGPPAFKVRWKLKDGETELAEGGNSAILLPHQIELISLRWMRRLSLMEFLPGTQQQSEDRIGPYDRRSLRLPSKPSNPDEEFASSVWEAAMRDLRYWTIKDATAETPADSYFESPRTKRELAESCKLTQELKLVVECEDLRGQAHSQDFSLQLPAHFTFAIPNRSSEEEGWAITEVAAAVAASAPDVPMDLLSQRLLAAATDTAESPTNRQEQPFLFAVLDCSGAALVPGASIDHRSEFNTYLSAEGVILLAGKVHGAPAGRYRIEILSEDAPLTHQEFVVFPLSRFLKPMVAPSVMTPLISPRSFEGHLREAIDRFRKHCGLGPTDARIDELPGMPPAIPVSAPSVPMGIQAPGREPVHSQPGPVGPAPAAPAPAPAPPAAPAVEPAPAPEA